MRTILWTLETPAVDLCGEVEVEDSATDAEIEALVREAMWDLISLSWDESPND